ncbi:helix-turn-helix transcriptional regulator [Neorhizobium sp. T6_25]|uniref:helix-turn-helix domain-containing protein n=1 Tax=Neorhizobium sp. T6_25 TaxID=2093833 RepID=UPI000CF948CE|nr:helix-turn-helix transcriptional regulator [Neorhizobium sp. T6_25]
MSKIDSKWFYEKLEQQGASLRDMARFMSLDPSAISRMLKGERNMSAEEQDQVAAFLDVRLEEVASHRRGEPAGLGEKQQEVYLHDQGLTVSKPGVKMFTEADIIYKDGKRWMEGPDGELLELHPAYGSMKGTITIPDDLDLTAPADPNWGKVYEDD